MGARLPFFHTLDPEDSNGDRGVSINLDDGFSKQGTLLRAAFKP